jgi:ActR/RegA family two-component response regulator
VENDKINLLIVDDEVQFLNSISKSLEAREFNVIAVDRGEKAIEAARKKSHRRCPCGFENARNKR